MSVSILTPKQTAIDVLVKVSRLRTSNPAKKVSNSVSSQDGFCSRLWGNLKINPPNPLACRLLNLFRMTNTSFTVEQKGGVKQINMLPGHKEEAHFGMIDGALVLGFMAAFIGLVCLLAK